ncbi:MAG: 4a-hydroxytetrahydrobiopterin dehydratase [Gaiellaceae bacterium]
MSDLTTEHCQEYPKGTPPLSEAEAAELHREVQEWERDGNQALRRELSFPDFNAAFGLVARVALLAEAESHHPEIELEWGRAAFRFYTHTVGGLSRNDFIMAAKIDQLAQAA